MKLGILCGGPSLERGISLNSARSVLDHLESDNIEIIPFYLDHFKKPYKISKNQLYSNTPSDFDFKLKQTSTPLSNKQFVNALKKTDIVFPVIHGSYGEDGGVQSFLEKHNIPFIGTDSKACKMVFDKYRANSFIKDLGFYTLPIALLKIYDKNNKKIIINFFKKHKIKRAVVKPASGGSSIGVFSVNNIDEAIKKVNLIFSKRMDTRVVIEPFAVGKEFTVIILQNHFNLPVAILPTEIETDYTKNQIFDYRRKYLPTRQVTYHCPPRFDRNTIEKIQVQAEQLFAATGMRDFGRFDGWILENGEVCFSDFNPISGMEQNSFLFQQASRIGLSHSAVFTYILKHACQRYKIKFSSDNDKSKIKRKPVNVIFGGNSSERQVSLMSGTNVWLKLCSSKKYEPKPFLLDLESNVWQLPYHLTLNHTVEEIVENCQNAPIAKERLSALEQKVRLKLGLCNEKKSLAVDPKKMTLSNFINKSKSKFVFNALHGGIGEDGTLQRLLTNKKIKYNGPDEEASKLSMDKWETSQKVRKFKIKGLEAIPSKAHAVKEFNKFKNQDFKNFWHKLSKELNTRFFLVKPRSEGCSSGVVRIYSHLDLIKYIEILKNGSSFIAKNTFKDQSNIIEMPLEPIKKILIEKFIETDKIHIKASKLKHYRNTGWIEITVGFIQDDNKIKIFNPSITVAEGGILSVEEKFQGGTGINITPPPQEIVTSKALNKSKNLIKKFVTKLNITGYSRIDAFMNIKTGNLKIIEINTLPALTPSTVLYHQALTEKPAITPRELLEKLIKNKHY